MSSFHLILSFIFTLFTFSCSFYSFFFSLSAYLHTSNTDDYLFLFLNFSTSFYNFFGLLHLLLLFYSSFSYSLLAYYLQFPFYLASLLWIAALQCYLTRNLSSSLMTLHGLIWTIAFNFLLFSFNPIFYFHNLHFYSFKGIESLVVAVILFELLKIYHWIPNFLLFTRKNNPNFQSNTSPFLPFAGNSASGNVRAGTAPEYGFTSSSTSSTSTATTTVTLNPNPVITGRSTSTGGTSSRYSRYSGHGGGMSGYGYSGGWSEIHKNPTLSTRLTTTIENEKRELWKLKKQYLCTYLILFVMIALPMLIISLVLYGKNCFLPFQTKIPSSVISTTSATTASGTSTISLLDLTDDNTMLQHSLNYTWGKDIFFNILYRLIVSTCGMLYVLKRDRFYKQIQNDFIRFSTNYISMSREQESICQVQFPEVEGLVIQKKIGESVAVVYKGKWRGTTVAVKMHRFAPVGVEKRILTISEQSELGAVSSNDIKKEAETMKRLTHPNLVLFMEAGYFRGFLCIITEYCRRGSLRDVLDKANKHSQHALNLTRRIDMALDTANALMYLHSAVPPIIHRDLKSPNVLITDNFRAKITDFGTARIAAVIVNHHLEKGQIVDTAGSLMTQCIGTVRWSAPELLTEEKYNEKVDVYSFGMVLWELLTGEVPFESIKWNSQVEKCILQGVRPPLPAFPSIPEWSVLIEKCWKQSPKDRPNIYEITNELKAIAIQYSTSHNEPSPGTCWMGTRLSNISEGASASSTSFKQAETPLLTVTIQNEEDTNSLHNSLPTPSCSEYKVLADDRIDIEDKMGAESLPKSDSTLYQQARQSFESFTSSFSFSSFYDAQKAPP